MVGIQGALVSASQELGLALSATQINALNVYFELFQKWNKAYNLSALRQPHDILVKHLLDCMAVVNPINTLLNERNHLPQTVLDVGTGAGLPGLVIAICLPAVQVTMLDAVQKKITFVQHAIGQLKLNNATAHSTRIQDWQGSHTVVTARAWTTLADIPNLTAHALAHGGCIAAMKGPRLTTEAETLTSQWHIEQILPMIVPQLNEERSLAVILRNN